MYTCVCFAVDENTILKIIEENKSLSSDEILEAIKEKTDAVTNCCLCESDIKQKIEDR